ncbi:helix-turn-helix transcriptional regulator [Azospirillum brasilense]|uniref:helix-turn-helix transcriptional regulator n=1 Tax=Azospirillum brasilense TaxID=192 RepID=UPI000E67DD47|nr:LuxR C-terminal-related transcriptional regulator [Azospirillum brasilense]NUB24726.1 hypothetical protein [Azospirillum brasilense]NUB30670.1 hypothetical protein [Azospirillum brasilense]RIW08280.1 hypothetical protein D2T81_00785 [Azospirillum brasilense]
MSITDNSYPEERITLTETEKGIIMMLMIGGHLKEIARLLSVTEYRVNSDLMRLRWKLRCDTNTQLVAKAIGMGIVENVYCQ